MFPKAFVSLAYFFDPLILKNRFLAFLQFLSITPGQFTKVFAKIAQSENADIEPRHFPSLSPQRTFYACPTVLLRLITPTGFSVTVRALLDSGSSQSFIFSDLSTLLLENGATFKHIWPYTYVWPFWKQHTLIYRKTSELKFQSVENESWIITTSIAVEESFAYMTDMLPVDLVMKKMAFFGLPMAQTRKLGMTMWSLENPKYVYIN